MPDNEREIFKHNDENTVLDKLFSIKAGTKLESKYKDIRRINISGNAIQAIKRLKTGVIPNKLGNDKLLDDPEFFALSILGYNFAKR